MKIFLKNILAIGCIFVILAGCQTEKTKVGFITNSQLSQSAEIDSAKAFLERNDNFNVETVAIKEVTTEKLSANQFDVIWYHREDSSDISSEEKGIASAIKEYVTAGGNLWLTLDGVRLLNSWEIEPQEITSANRTIEDHGFGRGVGYRGFRGHPVFDGMHGGAFVWHAKKDHKARRVGFFGDALPEADGSKVVGIEWTYITYHEENKLVWETPLGEGNILATGAYLNFSEPNFQDVQLHRFAENALSYLANGKGGEAVTHWSYESPTVQKSSLTFDSSAPLRSSTWTVPQATMELTEENPSQTYWDVSGRRMLIMGSDYGSIEEIWTHPIMSLRDFKVGFKNGKSQSPTWLNDLTPQQVSVRPEAIISEYQVGDASVKQIVTASIENPTGVVHYEWEGDLEQISVQFASNLRYMWPYDGDALGSLYYGWSNEQNSFYIHDKSRDFNTMVGFDKSPSQKVMGKYDGFTLTAQNITGKETEKNQVAGAYQFDVKDANSFDVIIASGNEGIETTENYFKEAAANPSRVLEKGNQYYADFLADKVQIEGPDDTFNEGFKWSLAGAENFKVTTPGIGTSMMAGFAPTSYGWDGGHEVNGRPGYAWYFGRDAQWSGLAMNAYGDSEGVKSILKTFHKYQDLNGKIYHELTTSGSVHYDASDATPLYLILASHYLKYTGDIAFLQDNWNHIEQALAYLESTDTDGDGFIENTNVGHGWLEGGELFGSHTSFYLAGLWVDALKEAGYLHEQMGYASEAKKYHERSAELGVKLNEEYWNEEGFFNLGKKADGSFIEQETILPAVPIYLQAVQGDRAEAISSKYINSEFTTDWGVRILKKSSDLYNPSGYHYGSVWPLFTGWVSLAEYETGEYNQGFTHAMQNMLIYKSWSLGDIAEVLHGEKYQPSGVTHHQAWSHTMVLQPLLEGMLGLRPNAPENKFSMSPRFPWDWDSASVDNISIGERSLDMEMSRSANEQKYSFDLNAESQLALEFSPAFPPGTNIESVKFDGQELEFKQVKESQAVVLKLKSPVTLINNHALAIKTEGGIGTVPSFDEPQVSGESNGLRILDEKFEDNSLKVDIEGEGGKKYTFKIYSAEEIKNVEGAQITEKMTDIYKLETVFDANGSSYHNKTIKVNLK